MLKKIVNDLECNNCGKCCMNFPLPKGFAGSTPQDTVDDSKSWNLKNGWCKYLIDNEDGTYKCGNYEGRPSVCKQFPTIKKEKPIECSVINKWQK